MSRFQIHQRERDAILDEVPSTEPKVVPGFELKFPPKPHYRPAKPVPVPVGKWFHIVAHVKLDEKDGLCELWQDGTKVCSGKGPTLPFAESIYNSLEVGISATQVESTVWVDDVEVSNKPLNF